MIARRKKKREISICMFLFFFFFSFSIRFDWVQIIEPKSKDSMYANLVTGECLWQAPSGAKM